MKKILFSSGKYKSMPSIALLILRASFGLMMIRHGWPKIVDFASMAPTFPDPLHVGSSASLGLCIFAEFFCSILVVLGLGTRFASIPLIINMAVISAVVLARHSFADRELAMLYLSGFIAVLIFGPGSYSLDRAISGK